MRRSLSCLLLLHLIVFAQPAAARIRFTDTSNKWTAIFAESASGVDYRHLVRYEWGRDTVVNSRTYKRLKTRATLNYVKGDSSLVSPVMDIYNRFLFREDTVLRNVWVYDSVLKQEKLIYKHAWRVGDTLLIWHPTAKIYTGAFVKRIDSVQIRNEWHRVFQFNERNDNNGDDSYAIIEGIGCTSSPAFPAGGYDIAPAYSWTLYCFANKGANPAVSPAVNVTKYGSGPAFDNANSCSAAVKLAIQQTGSGTPQVRVLPTPANGMAVLELLTPLTDARLLIYDALGRLMLQQELRGEQRIPIGQTLGRGLHTWQILDKRSGTRSAGTFTTE